MRPGKTGNPDTKDAGKKEGLSMTNMVQNAKDQAAALAMAAYRAAAGDGPLPQAEVPAAPV